MTVRPCETLILLVGSNPLPNYLAAHLLKPKKLILIATPEMIAIKDRLATELLPDWPGPGQIEMRTIESATQAAAVRAALGNLPADAHLHYTGGTKTMSAHARLLFAQTRSDHDRHASYLDDDDGVLRYDDGYDVPLAGASFGLDAARLLRLHGAVYRPSSEHDDTATPGQADGVARAVFANPELVSLLHARFDEKKVKAQRKAGQAAPIPPEIGWDVPEIPATGWTRKRVEDVAELLHGKWLEMWTGARVREVCPDCSVDVGVSVRRDGRDAEIDVLAVRGHRAFLLSCTTSREAHLCKSKLFEAVIRGEQLAGAKIRVALVSLLDKQRAAEVRKDLKSVWLERNEPRVFGLDDLRRWGRSDDPDRLDDLSTWLSS